MTTFDFYKEAKKLTAKSREHIKSKNFAEPGKKKYPIEDASHARNALARVSQFGSPSEKTQVRAKVHAKYPEMGKESADNKTPWWNARKRQKETMQDMANHGYKVKGMHKKSSLNDIVSDAFNDELQKIAKHHEYEASQKDTLGVVAKGLVGAGVGGATGALAGTGVGAGAGALASHLKKKTILEKILRTKHNHGRKALIGAAIGYGVGGLGGSLAGGNTGMKSGITDAILRNRAKKED